jgi:hypothetical protein
VTETQTFDLASWLTHIWDEEGRLAERAGDWLTAPEIDNYGHLTVPSAWMLARIAADRKILALHKPTPTTLEEVDGREVEADSFEEIVSREVNCMACAGYPEAPCPTLRLLASPYKGREGWQEEWE